MNSYISPKFYPNKQFKAVQKNIKKIKQTKKQGFSDNEIWSLDITTAEWLLPKLKKSLTIINKQDIEINEIVWFLGETAEERAIWPGVSKEHYKKITDASLLFGQNILRLSADKEESKKIANEFAIWFLPRLKRLFEVELEIMFESTKNDYNEIIWMFEQIIKKDTSSARFKRAQEIFGESFLNLWS